MALPLLLTLFVLLMTLGRGAIALVATSAAARTDAWGKRGGRSSDDVFAFGRASQSFAKGHAQQAVEAPPVLGDWAAAEANHQVMFGSWADEIDLNRPLSLELYAKVGARGAGNLAGGLQGLAADPGQIISGLPGMISGALQQYSSAKAQGTQWGQAAQQANREKVKEKVREQKALLEDAQGKVRDAERRIADLQSSIDGTLREKGDKPTIDGNTVSSSLERVEALRNQPLAAAERQKHLKALEEKAPGLVREVNEKRQKEQELKELNREVKIREKAQSTD